MKKGYAEKSKSQVRAQKPPIPSNSKAKPEPEPEYARRVGNIRNKRTNGEYNTDIDAVIKPKQSKIPRLQASVDRIPQPKKVISQSEYNSEPAIEPKQNLRRSQSFLENKKLNSKPIGNNLQNIKISNSASKPMVGDKLTNRRSINYKPYTLRQYKDKVGQEQLFTEKTRGGLGANIGGEEWQKENEKRQRMKEFANRVKQNQGQYLNDGMRRTNQSSITESREK